MQWNTYKNELSLINGSGNHPQTSTSKIINPFQQTPSVHANMKLAALTAFVSLALASPILERETPQCSVHGVRGAIPTQIEQSAFARIQGIKSVEQCNAKCKHPDNKQCKAFTVRTTGNGACLLYSAESRTDPTPLPVWSSTTCPRASAEGLLTITPPGE